MNIERPLAAGWRPLPPPYPPPLAGEGRVWPTAQLARYVALLASSVPSPAGGGGLRWGYPAPTTGSIVGRKSAAHSAAFLTPAGAKAECAALFRPTLMNHPPSVLELTGVAKQFASGLRALAGVSLTVDRGEFVRPARPIRLRQEHVAANCRRLVAPERGELPVAGRRCGGGTGRRPAASGLCFRTRP